jgi:hypothetical protein
MRWGLNQKGLDFVPTGDAQLRSRPLYRLFLSGSRLSREARRFSLLWGIITVEPDLMPLPVLHWLAGSTYVNSPLQQKTAHRIWREIPIITLLGGAAAACTGRRSDRMISRFIGESYGWARRPSAVISIIPAVEGTMAAIDLAKGKLSRAEFIRRAIAKAVELELHKKLKPKGGK